MANVVNFLDRLPPWARHAAILVLGALLTWAGTDLVPALQDKGGLSALVGAAVTMAILVLTPITSQYGVGKTPGPVDTGEATPAAPGE